jgi:hypothetical protein
MSLRKVAICLATVRRHSTSYVINQAALTKGILENRANANIALTCRRENG